MNQLATYLLEHLIIDFQGDLDLDTIKGFLKEDSSAAAKDLVKRIARDGGVDDMVIALADCLRESIRTGINEPEVVEQIRLYADS